MMASMLDAFARGVSGIDDGQPPGRGVVGFALGFVAGVAAVTAVVMAMFWF
jgi:hypothetical protein